jgi:hypothetical protein
VTKRPTAKRRNAVAAWLAIIALLIDALLPAAVSAATPDAAAPTAMCSAAAGVPSPGRTAPTLPTRHCALCAGVIAALLPSRPGEFAARLLAGAVHPANIKAATAETRHAEYAAAQPRAPPPASS